MEFEPSDIQTQIVASCTDDLLVSEMNGEIVMISLTQGKYFGLDAVGSYIWNRIQEPIPVSDLCRQLDEDFVGDPQAIRRDLLQYLESLAQKKLIRVYAS